jgi:hypothetical protein
MTSSTENVDCIIAHILKVSDTTSILIFLLMQIFHRFFMHSLIEKGEDLNT